MRRLFLALLLLSAAGLVSARAEAPAVCAAALQQIRISGPLTLEPKTLKRLKRQFAGACADDRTGRRMMLALVRLLRDQQMAVRGSSYVVDAAEGRISLFIGSRSRTDNHYVVGIDPKQLMSVALAEVTGEPVEGGVLVLRYAVTPPDIRPRIEWLRDGRIIAGAGGPRYRMTAADVGRRISARLNAPAGMALRENEADRIIAFAQAPVAAAPRVAEAPKPPPVKPKAKPEPSVSERVAELMKPDPNLPPEQQIDILFDLLFTDPTNLELNFLLIEAQTKTGDLKGALATLERVLLIDPDSKLARILFAEAQFSLGNNKTAKLTLLELIDEADTPDEMRGRAEAIVRLIEDQEQPYTLAFTAGYAAGAAENARGAAASDTILFIDLPVQNTVIDKSESFQDLQATATLTRELTAQTPQNVSASLIFNRRDYFDYNDADLDSLVLALGYNSQGDTVWSAGLSGTSVSVAQNDYLQALGLNANVTLAGKAHVLSFGGSFNDSSFTNLPGGSGAELRDGQSLSLFAALNLAVAERPLALRYSFADNGARRDYFANTNNNLSLQTSFNFGRWAGGIGLSFKIVDYDAPDPLVSAVTTRRDETLGLNVSLQRLLFSRGDKLVSFIGKADSAATGSNIPNYEKDAASLSLGISARF